MRADSVRRGSVRAKYDRADSVRAGSITPVLLGYFMGMLLFGFASAVVSRFPVIVSWFPGIISQFPRTISWFPGTSRESFPEWGSFRIFQGAAAGGLLQLWFHRNCFPVQKESFSGSWEPRGNHFPSHENQGSLGIFNVPDSCPCFLQGAYQEPVGNHYEARK